MTIREFAKLCNVSPATVSRYFSGQANVGRDVQQKIREMAEKTGYAPPENYRSRRKNGSGIVGVLVPDFDHYFYIDVLKVLGEEAGKYNKRLVLIPVDSKNPLGCMDVVAALSLDGMILLDEGMDPSLIQALGRRGIPMVMCGAQSLGQKISAVHIDDLSGAYDATNYLIGLGHRDIAFVSDLPHSISAGFQRITGCKKALEDAGISVQEQQFAYAGSTFSEGGSGMKTLIDRGIPMTAVFAFSDDMAAGAVAVLRDHGYRVPEDISVMGFDDSSAASKFRPQLTTLHQPIALMAQKSMERLHAMRDASDITSITLPHSITVRDSCRRIG